MVPAVLYYSMCKTKLRFAQTLKFMLFTQYAKQYVGMYVCTVFRIQNSMYVYIQPSDGCMYTYVFQSLTKVG